MRESRGKGIPRGFFYCVKICMKDSKFVRWFHIMRTFQIWKLKINLDIFAHTQKSIFFMTEVHLYWGPLIPFQAINSTNLFPLSYFFFGGQKSELEEDPCISSKICFKLIFF